MTTTTEIKNLIDSIDPSELADLKQHIVSKLPDSYTPGEVEGALRVAGLLGDGWGEIEWLLKYRKLETINLRDTEVKVEVLATDDGGEYGYETFVVIGVGDQLFRKTGHYQSHYGNDWDGPFEEVKVIQKTVSVYERV